LRAERGYEVLMSACPQDTIAMNANSPMEQHFFA